MATLTPIQGASPLDANDASYVTFTDDATQTVSYAVDNVDADLASMDSLSWQIDYSLRAARTDDTYALALRIMSGATVLAAADSGGTFVTVSSSVTSTTDTLSSVTAFAYVNTAASKTLWDAATVELRQTYAKTKGNDVTAIRVDFVEFTGVYTVAAPTFTGTVAVTQAGDTLSASGSFSAGTRTGSASLTQASDTVTASGSFTPPTFTGDSTVTQESDTVSASGTFAIPLYTGTANPTQEADTVTASGTFIPPTFTGTATLSQASDTSVASGTSNAGTVTGSATPTQASDVCVASGSFTAPWSATGSANITQDNQTVSAVGTGGSILPHATGKSTAVLSNTNTPSVVINTSTGKVSLSSSGASTAEGN